MFPYVQLYLFLHCALSVCDIICCTYVHMHIFIYFYTILYLHLWYSVLYMYVCFCTSVFVYTIVYIHLSFSIFYIYIYMSICTSISVCILCCIKHFIFELMNNIFKSARTCFGSQRIHHQWALYSAWLKITKMILSCPLTWTRSVLWQHILTEIRWNNDGLFRDKLKAKTTLSKKSRYNKV